MLPSAQALLILSSLAGTPATPVSCVVDGGPAAIETPAFPDRCHAPEPATGQVTAEQLDAIVQWLTESFDLPASTEHPAVVFENPADLARMRNGGIVPYRETQREPGAEQRAAQGDILALYHDARRTIYLSDGWTGATDAEMSVLVHEMVHHLQNVAGLRYSCAGEREKLAYRAQSAWLRQTGKSLASEFQLDEFSLLVRSNCMM